MEKHSNSELLARFETWCPEVRKILSLTGTYLKWKLADFDQLKNWIHPSNHAVLLGDACHPMMPVSLPIEIRISLKLSPMQWASHFLSRSLLYALSNKSRDTGVSCRIIVTDVATNSTWLKEPHKPPKMQPVWQPR